MADTDQLQQPMQVPGMPGQPTPVQAPVQDNSDPLQNELLAASQQGRQYVAEQIARARSAGDQAAGYEQQLSQLRPPQMGFQPHFGGGILHDIGQALLAVGAATKPGEAIQGQIYGPQIRQYGEQRKQLADQITSARERQKAEEEPIGAAAGMSYHPYQAIMQGKRIGVEQERVDNTKAFHDQLMTLDTAKLGESERHNRVDELLRGQGVQVQRERNQVLLSLGGQRISVDQAKFDAAVNNKNQGFFDQIFSALGLKQFQGVGGDTSPVDVTSPTAKSVTDQGKKTVKDATKPNKSGGVIYARDPQGKLHQAPAGTSLPQGWKLENRK